MAHSIEIIWAPDKFLEKLSRQQPSDGDAIEDALDDLGEQPQPPGCTPLRGHSDVWRLRVGNYRICYRIEDDRLVVLVVTISTRDDAYEILRRALGW